MALEVNKVSREITVSGPEKMVKANLIKGGGRGKSGDMSANPGLNLVAAHDHGHGIPTDNAFDTAFDIAVPGVGRLFVIGNGVNIGGIGHKRQGDPGILGPDL